MAGSWLSHNNHSSHETDEFKGKSLKYLEEAYVILLHRASDLLNSEREELGRIRDELEKRLGRLDHEKYNRMVSDRQKKLLQQSRESNADVYRLLQGVQWSVHAVSGF